MEKDMRLLLAETALMATGMHRHEEAEIIASCIESQEDTKEAVAMIRSMSLMNRGRYEDAHRFLEPLCTDYPDLVSLAALAAGKAGLTSRAESWLEMASKGSAENQAFAMSFSKDIRNL
ncbi:YscG family type III secretion system chaperone [Grimontia marina]|uniref:Putative Yop proteins translocation protein G n=1 Tax=Grimontia marina TaxID=646534 RepID=A0A128FHZ6_9GAMM|nr:YscG family type III secretion system chaperone [Grimontia marina]CZF86419.1 Putative Yop proteins translocation protein G [Grimontia marina]